MIGKAAKDNELMERWLAVCGKPRQEYVAQENLERQAELPSLFAAYSDTAPPAWALSGRVEILFPFTYLAHQSDPKKHCADTLDLRSSPDRSVWRTASVLPT